jgi:hypothetical protein
MKKYFIIYNDDTHCLFNNQLIITIKRYSPDFEIIIFNKSDISQEFKEANKQILNLPRGGGYWLWKPYIINETLKKIKEDDLLFYLDSKYFFIEDFTELYREPISKKDIILWKNKPNEPIYFMKNWCKRSVIEKYGMQEKVFQKNALDCWAGCIFIKKSDFSVNFMKEWLDMCCVYEDITDYPSSIQNTIDFRDHRHDQSLLSILIHKYNIEMETFEKKYLQNVRRPF